MAGTRFPNLFTPIQIGNMMVKNRIFMSAMSTALCSMDNQMSDEAIAYYSRYSPSGG